MALKVIIAEAAHDENGSGNYGYEGSKAGDQLQKNQTYSETTSKADYYADEVRFHDWYNKPWRHIYRSTDDTIRDEIAIRAEQTVRNQNVGYSQPKRLTYHNLLVNDPDPSHISVKCECDCSSMVNTIVLVTLKAHGITPTINGQEVTAQMANKYNKMCPQYFTDVISEVNLTTGEGIKRGDILLGDPATHTAIVLSVDEETVTNKTSKWVGEVYNCTTLNVRTGAGTNYPNYSAYPYLSKGNQIEVCDEVNGWYYVCIAGKHYAYVSAKYIKQSGTAETTTTTVKKELAVGETVTFNGDYLYVSSYSNGKMVSATAYKGKTAKITKHNDKAHPWHIAGSGFSGWANTSDLTI